VAHVDLSTWIDFLGKEHDSRYQTAVLDAIQIDPSLKAITEESRHEKSSREADAWLDASLSIVEEKLKLDKKRMRSEALGGAYDLGIDSREEVLLTHGGVPEHYAWYVVAAPVGTQGGTNIQEGADVHTVVTGALDEGKVCRLVAVEETNGRRLRGRIVEPSLGWVNCASIQCFSGNCGFCGRVECDGPTPSDNKLISLLEMAEEVFDQVSGEDGVMDKVELIAAHHGDVTYSQ